MNSNIVDSLKSQLEYALAVLVLSGSVLVSSLTANLFELFSILVLFAASLILFLYSLGIVFYIKKGRHNLGAQQIDTVMEKHASFPFIQTLSTAFFIMVMMMIRSHHSLAPAFIDIIFSVSVVMFTLAMANSSFINIAKIMLINHRVIIASKTV